MRSTPHALGFSRCRHWWAFQAVCEKGLGACQEQPPSPTKIRSSCSRQAPDFPLIGVVCKGEYGVLRPCRRHFHCQLQMQERCLDLHIAHDCGLRMAKMLSFSCTTEIQNAQKRHNLACTHNMSNVAEVSSTQTCPFISMEVLPALDLAPHTRGVL